MRFQGFREFDVHGSDVQDSDIQGFRGFFCILGFKGLKF
jgi:hypothetical protein